jgi:hypothetical protein
MENPAGSINVAKLLSGLGITTVDTQDVTANAVQEEIDATGVSAKVTGIRWGAVHIEGGSAEIAQLMWHRDKLVEKARNASDGEVTRVVMKVKR